MPNYNNALFLNEAIDSILNQTYNNFIFLIIDDGSTDKSIEIINSYNDPRIQLIKKESNSGIVDTLNIGIKHLDTKYYVRMDGDDISVPNRLQLLFDFMENNPEVGVCGSHSLLFGDINELWKQELNRNKIKAKIIYCGGVSHGPSIYRTAVLKNNNILYTNNHPYLEDYDLFFRLKQFTQYAHLDEALYHYRVLKHNSTVKNQDTLLIRYKAIYKKVIAELGIELTENNVDTHLQLFLGHTVSFPIGTYKKYINTILERNAECKIYPQKELAEVLHDKWEQFFYKVVPLSLSKSIAYFFVSDKIYFKHVLYLLKFKINKLIGRNQ
jgi:glycosyltransferase involved in cell wall biosynthesis